MSEPAKLPEALRTKPPQYLRNLQTGDIGFISFTDMVVDAEGRCFLRPGAELIMGHRSNAIRVELRTDGHHVTVRKPMQWTLENRETAGLSPVADISVIGDDDHWVPDFT